MVKNNTYCMVCFYMTLLDGFAQSFYIIIKPCFFVYITARCNFWNCNTNLHVYKTVCFNLGFRSRIWSSAVLKTKHQLRIWLSGEFLGMEFLSLSVLMIICSDNFNLYKLSVLSLCCFSLANRVGENWPLYDILNQFQKGQCHMAVVVKCEENTRTAATSAQGKILNLVLNNDSHSKLVTTRSQARLP